MARSPISAPGIDFDPESVQLVARKPLTLDGVDYHDGDNIPRGILTPRRARQLFESRRLGFVYQNPHEGGPKPVEPVEPVPGTGAPQDGEKAASGADSAKQAPFDPSTATLDGGYTVEHRGFGSWFILSADGAEHGPFKKAAVAHLKAQD